jgi:transcriptional regulator with XRE-family HTH domain
MNRMNLNRNRLRQVRTAAGMTQRTLATLSGIPKTCLQRVDSNPRARITLEAAARIAPVLRVDPLELLPAALRCANT